MSSLGRELQLTLQAALGEAVQWGHSDLTVEHLLYALLHNERGAEVLRHSGADTEQLKQALQRFFEQDLERVGEGEPRPEQIRQTLAFHRVLQHALQSADNAEKEEIEAGDLLAAIFQEPDSHAVALLRGQEVSRLDVLRYVSHGTSRLDAADTEGYPRPEGAPPSDGSREEGVPENPLEAFASDLTAAARGDELDPLIGREKELERVLHVLTRRRKNNPLLVGESGVGKTAIAEGLAQRLAAGRVPDKLRSGEIFSLDLGALLAGTRYRGDFEARFKALIHALGQRDQPILFIDEIHTVVGAGGGTVDASHLLKPLLGAGRIRCLGSTTYRELRHFERDRALARRFQMIDVPEPSLADTVQILRGLAPHYEKHHEVQYSRAALRAAAELSAKHLNDRFLPDKAIDVVDEAGAALQLRPGSRRSAVGVRDIEATIARMARIPVARAASSDRNRLEQLETELGRVVFAQEDAVATVARAVRRAHAGLGGEQRPIGSFLFAGPTGVGKTELAVQLARCLGVAFVRFDMSEYMEQHAVSRLIGAPPGYVGYDEGGQLVERIRKQPYAVLLLDEIEKAHPQFFDILLQVMDHATLTDNHGREADFRHVVLIMTSNAGARELAARSIGFGDVRRGDSRAELARLFSPEFRNRLDEVVQFKALAPEAMLRIVDKFVGEVREQLRARKVRLALSDAARTWLADEGYDPDFGARPLARVVQRELRDPMADALLFGPLVKGGTVTVDRDADADGGGLRFDFEAAGATATS